VEAAAAAAGGGAHDARGAVRGDVRGVRIRARRALAGGAREGEHETKNHAVVKMREKHSYIAANFPPFPLLLPMRSFALLLLALALPAAAATAAVPPPEPCVGAHCQACRTSSGTTALNFLHGLHRYNMGRQSATADMSVLAVCPRDAAAYDPRSEQRVFAQASLAGCDLDGADAGLLRGGAGFDITDVDPAKASSDKDSPISYVQGTLTTPAFGAITGVFTLLVGLVFVVFRWCCPCCCPKGGGCGSRYPTIEAERYPPKQVWGARACMLVFLVLLATLVGCVQAKGNLAVAPAMLALAEAPSGAADLAAAIPSPALEFAQRVLGETVFDALRGFNATFIGSFDLRAAAGEIECLAGAVEEARTLPKTVLAALAQLQLALALLPPIAAVDGNLTALNGSALALKGSAATLKTSLAQLDVGLGALQAGPSIAAPAIDLLANASALGPIAAAVKSNATALDASLPTVGDLDALDAAIGRVTASATAATPGGARDTDTDPLETGQAARADARDKLLAMMATASAVSVAALVGEVNRLNATLDNIAAAAAATVVALNQTNFTLAHTLPAGAPIIAALGAIDVALAAYAPGDIVALVASVNASVNALPPLPPLETLARTVPPLLRRVVPCASSLAGRLDAVGASLLVLPAGVADLQAQAADINGTANDAIEQVLKLADQVAEAEVQLNNATATRAELDATLAKLPNRTALSPLNTTALQADITDVDTNRVAALASLGGLRTAAEALRDGAGNPADRPSASVTSSLQTIEKELNDTLAPLQAALDALDAWGRGLCLGADNNPRQCDCATPGASGRSPAPGDFTCLNAGAEWGCQDGAGVATACDKKTAFLASGAAKTALQDQVTAAQSSVGAAKADIAARPSAAEIGAQMDALEQASKDGAPPAGSVEQLQDMEAALAKLPRADVATWQQQVADLDGPLADLPDFGALRENLRSINATLEGVKAGELDARTKDLEAVEALLPNATLLSDGVACTADAVSFVYGDGGGDAPLPPYVKPPANPATSLPAVLGPPALPPSLSRTLRQLSYARLAEITLAHGQCEALAHLAAAAEEAANEAGSLCANLTGGAGGSLAQRIRDARRSASYGDALTRCRRLTLPRAERRTMGAVAYLADVAAVGWVVSPPEAVFSNPGSTGYGPQVTVDADDAPWDTAGGGGKGGGGGACVQLRCIANSVARFNSGAQPLPGKDNAGSAANAAISGGGRGRETAYGVLLVAPLLVLLAGALALALRKGCCALTMALLIFAMAPWILTLNRYLLTYLLTCYAW
jgi:hypothetical protein